MRNPMRDGRSWRLWLSLLGVLGGLALPGAAAAGVTMGAHAGAFSPWQGDGDESVAAHVLAVSRSGRFRWGAEFEYREFDTKIFRVRDVNVESYIARLLFHWVIVPKGPLHPYVGLSINSGVNRVDDDLVDAQKGRNAIADHVVSAGFDGIVGIEVSLARWVSLYGEGRLGYSAMVTERKDTNDVKAENFGGATGVAGIRFNF
jgi:hypothetical protein